MNRRDFLLLNVRPGTHVRVLSCEEMYMRFLDSQNDGSTQELLGRLRAELWQTDRVALSGEIWLHETSFRAVLEPLLDEFRARGGQVFTDARLEVVQSPRV